MAQKIVDVLRMQPAIIVGENEQIATGLAKRQILCPRAARLAAPQGPVRPPGRRPPMTVIVSLVLSLEPLSTAIISAFSGAALARAVAIEFRQGRIA